ncbi:MAG: hypothetical protein CMJ83_12860 [Planctomycetes bacterium]|nr:hypothetical protein [Planctomycetota bacterium]
MGNKYAKPDPLERARDGDEDALEQVLGGILAPLFDLALHYWRQPVRAELATVVGLQGLARVVRDGGPPDGVSPLAVAVEHLFASTERPPARTSSPDDLHRRLGDLEDDRRRAVLAFLACDLDEAELIRALGRSNARALLDVGLSELDGSESEIRQSLDEEAARTALPPGLVDRAL